MLRYGAAGQGSIWGLLKGIFLFILSYNGLRPLYN